MAIYFSHTIIPVISLLAGSISRDVHTAIIIAASSDSELVVNLKDVLEGYGGSIIIKSRNDVLEAPGDNNVKKLLAYIDNTVTGAVIVCSPDLAEFLDNATDESKNGLQISGEDIELNGVVLRQHITEHIENLGKKIILLSFTKSKQPDCLKNLSVENVELEDPNGTITERMLKDADVYAPVFARLSQIAHKDWNM